MDAFLKSLENFMGMLSGWIWGAPLLVLLVGTGLWLTVRLKGLQFTTLGESLYLAFIKRKEDDDDEEGDISHFQALMTAMSATVGTGNIAGVATAIALGGPGALFWMWITGLVGMATKYGEAVLAVVYREKDDNGNMCGGPMYYITNGLGWKWMGVLFAIFAAVAAFGIGNMVQSNSMADALNANFNVPFWVTGLVTMVFVGLVVIGGIKSIGRVTGFIVPFMVLFYVISCLIVLIVNFSDIPAAFGIIFHHAFNPTAATGGFAGSAVMLTIRMGVARGVFSNESGLGSAPIAAAAAKTKHPVTQALVSMTQTFIDTIIVCTMTGLVIVLKGAWTTGKNGADLTTYSFQLSAVPGGEYIVTIGLVLFAFSTILGWCYYGEKSIEYLFGEKAIMPYRAVFVLFAGIGAMLKLNLVWTIADVFNGLMAFPNLIALIALTPVIVKTTKDYFNNK
ncbi:MAG: alanine/glycine:cation symporter family protein [Desulfobacteraceae bacterium]